MLTVWTYLLQEGGITLSTLGIFSEEDLRALSSFLRGRYVKNSPERPIMKEARDLSMFIWGRR